MELNTPLQLAADFIRFTDKSVFLTGKAGTGKTTFLHTLRKTLPKRMVVVAPTGVAAINAGGVTIHSFFQLPFGPYLPGSTAVQVNRFNKEKISLLKSLDLLVIDEISMVRADTLDGIDEVLRRYRDRDKPFGGVQLLMIGDLHQLSPVVKEDEWALLRDRYDSMFFFGSRALQETNPVRIELTHIYRQSDTFFIDLLNKIRENQLDEASLAALNTRYQPDFRPDESEGYITLTAHNASAQEINQSHLSRLDGRSYSFAAAIDGDFPAYSYPTELNLELKVGAQVMFVKNDSSRDKLFYNGKIGRITRIEAEAIYVRGNGDYVDTEVVQAVWENMKYQLNPETKEVEEQVAGSFTQYPLKLAWAITIHKSQGLTFEKAIIDANASFAHGQVYVALSRCKSFEGMVLRSPIATRSVRTDEIVSAYNRDMSANPPGERLLTDSKKLFQQRLIRELFDFSEIRRLTFQLSRALEAHQGAVPPELLETVRAVRDPADQDIYSVASRFEAQLNQLFFDETLPEDDLRIQDRVQKGSAYFRDKMTLFADFQAMDIETDNQAVKKSAVLWLDHLQRALTLKMATLQAGAEGFHPETYLRSRADADIEFKGRKNAKTAKAPAKGSPQQRMFQALRKWRDETAAENNVPVYIVLPQKVLLELAERKPQSLAELEGIKGIGKTKIRQLGQQIVDIINAVLNQAEEAPSEKKENTKKITLDLFQEGKTIGEIAAQRGLTAQTIANHLVHYVETGDIDVIRLVSAEKVTGIETYLRENRGLTLSALKEGLGDEVSYLEIKAVLAHLTHLDS
jgi:hypothetical protein